MSLARQGTRVVFSPPIGWIHIAKWYCLVEGPSELKRAAVCGLKRALADSKGIREIARLRQAMNVLYETRFDNDTDKAEQAIAETRRILMHYKQFVDELRIKRISCLS